jgi:hypothetical protein
MASAADAEEKSATTVPPSGVGNDTCCDGDALPHATAAITTVLRRAIVR